MFWYWKLLFLYIDSNQNVQNMKWQVQSSERITKNKKESYVKTHKQAQTRRAILTTYNPTWGT